MKVLHININYLTTALHQKMIEQLDSMGVENCVFAPTADKRTATVVPNDNVIVKECFGKADRLIYFYKQKKIREALEECVDVRTFHVLHAYTLFSDGNVAYSLHQKYGIPYFVAIRDTDVNDFMRLRPHLLPRGVRIMANAEKVFFLSPAYKAKVLEKIGRYREAEAITAKSMVVPNGIDDFWFQNLNRNERDADTLERIDRKTLHMICIGKIIPRKNIPTLQEAIRILNGQGWKIDLTVVGKAEDDSLLQKITSDPATTYYPAMPKEKLIEPMRQADLFALVSKTETFGLVYAEALSQGLPVLYSKNEGFDGQFPEGEVGFAVQKDDPADIAEGIRKLAAQYGDIQARCTAGAEKYRWPEICDCYAKCYRETQNR